MKEAFVNSFLAPAILVWSQELGQTLELERAEPASDMLPTEDVPAAIIVQGSVEGGALYEFSESTARAVTTAMLGEPVEVLDDMSHEIRSPMYGITGMTELALKTELTPKQSKYLKAVQTSAESLMSIINGILDFSKIEARKMELNATAFSPSKALEDTLQPLIVRAEEKGLSLVSNVTEEVPEAIVGDPDRLGQIIHNLVGNAVKFTKQGSIEVSVELVSQDEEQTLLHFQIRDTGIGIPEEKQKMIFTAFTQVDGSMTRRYEGTGLGLAIASQLVELMGGRVWIESVVGVGSTFHFTIAGRPSRPLAPPEGTQGALDPQQVENDADLSLTTRPLRILVAEDNPVSQTVTAHLLETCGHSVRVVGDGAQALAAIQTGDFSLVLMDLEMPDMDGLEVTRRVRAAEQETDRHLPILALTAFAMTGDRDRCLAVGMDDYLSKPLEGKALSAAIDDLHLGPHPVLPENPS